MVYVRSTAGPGRLWTGHIPWYAMVRRALARITQCRRCQYVSYRVVVVIGIVVVDVVVVIVSLSCVIVSLSLSHRYRYRYRIVSYRPISPGLEISCGIVWTITSPSCVIVSYRIVPFRMDIVSYRIVGAKSRSVIVSYRIVSISRNIVSYRIVTFGRHGIPWYTTA